MSINLRKLNGIVDLFHSNHILCVGDIMLDEYISGPANRLSPEAPVPVIKQTHHRRVLGGVGNVAANLAELGCKTTVLYACGADSDAAKIKDMLGQKGIEAHPLVTETITTKKQRIMANKQQICRLDFEEPLTLSKQQEDKLIYQATSLLPQVNLVLLSDYNKGLITPRVAQGIIQAAQKTGKYVLVDPKGNDYTKYQGATLIKPNLSELKTAVAVLDPKSAIRAENVNPETAEGIEQIKALSETLRTKLNIQKSVITLSEYGMLGSEKDKSFYRPTMAKDVSDVSGAGDTSLAVLGAALATNSSLEDAMDLANIGAGVVVAKEGTATLSKPELTVAMKNLFLSEKSTSFAQNWNKQNTI